MAASKTPIMTAIREQGVIDEETEKVLEEAIVEYKERFKEEVEARSA
jgi:hypothetical protein